MTDPEIKKALKKYNEELEAAKNEYNINPTAENKESLEYAQQKLETCHELVEFMKKDKNNHYEVLGVDPSASEEQIKKSYKKLVLKFHPDRSQMKETRDAMQTVASSYYILMDSERRRAFDSRNQKTNPITSNLFNEFSFAQEERFIFNSDRFGGNGFYTSIYGDLYDVQMVDILDRIYRTGLRRRRRRAERINNHTSGVSVDVLRFILVLFFILLIFYI